MAKPQRDLLSAAAALVICRASAFGAIMLLLFTGTCAAQASRPIHKEQLQPSGASRAAPATKPRKIWTNDDFPDSSGNSVAATRSSTGSSDLAVFLTPHDGEVVQPGEALTIEISVSPGAVSGPVAIVSELGVSREVRTSAPYSFTMNVSRDDTVGAGSPLIGKHEITAFGKPTGQDGYNLASITLDVEEDQMPTKLSVGGNGPIGPQGMNFYAAGQQQTVAIYASFPNGDQFDVVDSTHLELVSGNPNVVNVGEQGWLTSIGPGETSITATYTYGGQTLQVSLPVSVTVPMGGLVPTPLSLDFGDQPSGRESAPLQVVLTNRSSSTIKVYKPEIRAAARESDDCTAAPLPPGASCTMSVTFFVIRPGRSVGVIFIPNSQSGQISIPVSGNGV